MEKRRQVRTNGNIYSRNFPRNNGLVSRVYINLVVDIFESFRLGVFNVAKNSRKPEFGNKLMHFLTLLFPSALFFAILCSTFGSLSTATFPDQTRIIKHSVFSQHSFGYKSTTIFKIGSIAIKKYGPLLKVSSMYRVLHVRDIFSK